MRTAITLSAIVIVLALALGVVCQADPVVTLAGPVSQDGFGLWTYNYVIDNTSGDVDIWDLFLQTNTDTAEIAATPPNWGTFYFPPGGGSGASADWTTPDFFADPQVYSPVTVGSNSFTEFASYFTLKSPYPVGTGAVQYSMYGGTVKGGPAFPPVAFEGSVDGPSQPTPEPVTLVLLAASGIGAFSLKRKQRS